MGKPLIDLTDTMFGDLKVIELGQKRRKTNGAWWLCLCVCGNKKSISANDLKTGRVKSCGCKKKINRRKSLITHGMTGTKTYTSWMAMKSRCNRDHPDYGGRGIKYDVRWEKFENFLEDMGEAPENTSLDRIDVNGMYTKDNCRWATKIEQQNNTRRNVYITWNDKTMTQAQWERELGMRPTTLRSRLRAGWSLEDAMTKPLKWVEEGNVAEEWNPDIIEGEA